MEQSVSQSQGQKGQSPKSGPGRTDTPAPVPPQPPISDPPPSESGELHDPVEPQPTDDPDSGGPSAKS
jgi:hypothetical protein